MEEIRNTEIGTEEKDAVNSFTSVEVKERKNFWEWLKEKLTRKQVWSFVVQLVVLVVIPEAFLFLCGFIFDKWLKLYNLTPVIFVVWVLLAIVAIALIILSVIGFCKDRKKSKIG